MAKTKKINKTKAMAKTPAKKASGAAAKLTKVVKKLLKKATPAGKTSKDEPSKEKSAPKLKASSAGGVKASAKEKAVKEKKQQAIGVEVEHGVSQKASKAAKKVKKKTEEHAEEDILGEVDDFGSDELSEYGDLDLEMDEESEESTEEGTEEESEDAEGTGVSEVVSAASDSASEEVILTDAEGRRYCRVRDCDQAAIVDAYCRYHYLLLWKRIQVRKKILVDGKLERYVEELTSRYPDKFLEVIRKDLSSEKDFLAAIQELEIDESQSDSDFEDETQSFIDEVRGVSDAGVVEDDEY